jgi:protein involved in polysaccharide export with SLBB domain
MGLSPLIAFAQNQLTSSQLSQLNQLNNAGNVGVLSPGGFNPSAPTPNYLQDPLLLQRAQQQQGLIQEPPIDTTLDSLLVQPTFADSSHLENLNDRFSEPERYALRIFKQAPNGSLFGSYYTSLGSNYVLGPGDKVTLSLWGDQERQYLLTVNTNGKAFVEGIGLVQVGGYTVADAEKRLTAKLATIYSGIDNNTTHAELSSVQAGPIRVFILGEVQQPGAYTFSGNTGVFSALYQAKGPSPIGNIRSIELRRGSQVYQLDLYDYLLKGILPSPSHLQDGDILRLKRAHSLVTIQGDIGRPDIYELKKGEGVKDLIQYAGQLNPSAATQSIRIERILPSGQIEPITIETPQTYMSGQKKFDLQDGDRVFIETSSELSKYYVEVAGSVKYPGKYAWSKGTTVASLLKSAGGLQEGAFLGRIHVVRPKIDGSSTLFSYSLDTTSLQQITLEGRDYVSLYSEKDMHVPDSVEVSGAIHFPGKYPFHKGMTPEDLILLAGGALPDHHESAVIFRSNTQDRSVQELKVPIHLGKDTRNSTIALQPKDFVLLPEKPQTYLKEIVTLSGQFEFPGQYSLAYPGESLVSVIQRAGGLKKTAYAGGMRFHRHKNDVGRMGINLVKALEKPNKDPNNVGMLHGDSVHVPEQMYSVKVVGAVGTPTSVLYREGEDIHYYIKRAGGYLHNSHKSATVLEYANGESVAKNNIYRDPDAGSVITVPFVSDEDRMQAWHDANVVITPITAVITAMGALATTIVTYQALTK